MQPHDTNLVRRNVVKAGLRLAGIAAVMVSGSQKSAFAAVTCFMRGTPLLISSGERNVEDLRIGDGLVTKSGVVKPIKWIGHYTYKRSDRSKPWVQDALPVRIVKSAFAPNVPDRDLLVTKGHAFLFDDVLVPVGSLLNGGTISLDPSDEFDILEFFHIKLEEHDVIFAANAPCETLLNVTETAANFAEYTRLYGAPARDEAPCVPIMGFCGGRSELASRMRSAVSPLWDLRSKLDALRDRIEARSDEISA